MAESFGLAMIIGAYGIGLALSNTSLAKTLNDPLRAVYHALVPILFVVMGMLVNVAAMMDVLAFGLVISALAIIGKVGGDEPTQTSASSRRDLPRRVVAWRILARSAGGEYGVGAPGV